MVCVGLKNRVVYLDREKYAEFFFRVLTSGRLFTFLSVGSDKWEAIRKQNVSSFSVPRTPHKSFSPCGIQK